MNKNTRDLHQLKMTTLNQELHAAFNSTVNHNPQITCFETLFALEDYRDACKRKKESNTAITTTENATSQTSLNVEDDQKEDIPPTVEHCNTNYYQSKVPKDPCRILKSLTSNEIRRLISTSYVIDSSFGKRNYCLVSKGSHPNSTSSKNTKRITQRQVL